MHCFHKQVTVTKIYTCCWIRNASKRCKARCKAKLCETETTKFAFEAGARVKFFVKIILENAIRSERKSPPVAGEAKKSPGKLHGLSSRKAAHHEEFSLANSFSLSLFILLEERGNDTREITVILEN